jgi:hypothetical protein
LVCLGTTTATIPQTTLNQGTGGAAGAGALPGLPGVASRAINCSFF